MLPIFVNEIFGPTIQGEGPSAGMPCMFLRTAHCNLSCRWCDTPYTWNWIGSAPGNHPDKFDRENEVHKMLVEDLLVKLEHYIPNALVISGGEPMLQQGRLVPLVCYLHKMGWRIEIETNGTVMPQAEFVACLDQINCSPKLSNSGDPFERRIKHGPLKALAANDKTVFKFVVGSETEQDLEEVKDLVRGFGMRDVWLMPQARTKEELEKNYPLVAEWAKFLGYNVSSRKHIELWGSKRGV